MPRIDFKYSLKNSITTEQYQQKLKQQLKEQLNESQVMINELILFSKFQNFIFADSRL